MQVYSHSYWLVIFCTTNSSSRVLARERWQPFENSWKKNSIFNEFPAAYFYSMNSLQPPFFKIYKKKMARRLQLVLLLLLYMIQALAQTQTSTDTTTTPGNPPLFLRYHLSMPRQIFRIRYIYDFEA